MSDVQQVVDSLNNRRIQMADAKHNTIDFKKYVVLTQLNDAFQNTLNTYYEKTRKEPKQKEARACLCMLDLLIAVLSMNVSDFNILCTQRSYTGSFFSAGVTMTGTLAGFLAFGPIGGVASFFAMSSRIGSNIKSAMGISGNFPRSVGLLLELIELCGNKFTKDNKDHKKKQQEQSLTEALLSKEDPFKFVSQENMPKTSSNVLDGFYYICIDDNKMRAVFKNKHGNLCSMQSTIDTKMSVLPGIDKLDLQRLKIMCRVLELLLDDNYEEHTEEYVEDNQLRI